MKVRYDRCAGLDIHKETVVACVVRSDSQSSDGATRKVQTFSTMTVGLKSLAQWLLDEGVTQVAMEATGVYWKPVYNILEVVGQFELMLVNAQHIKHVPGRKTDVMDAEWLAELLRHGLVRGSFVPDRQQRELRELTRYRTALLQERAREVNRLQKTLEGANIKLAAVLTDITGVSGQRILDALLAGETDPESLADLAHWRVQAKREALEQAVVGQLGVGLRFVVSEQLGHLRELDRRIEALDDEVERQMRPFAAELALVQTIPGVGPRTAQVILAEIGVDMSRFPSEDHLSSWAGMAPGNNASGGKKKPAPTNHGSPWLKAALAEAAWAASHCKAGYLPAQFRHLASRRGRKRAIVAVGHSILVIVYHLLSEHKPYVDLGGDYSDQRNRVVVERRAVKRLESLGYKVTLESARSIA